MSKNIEGVCKLCGKHKKLTFEHVPPESAFNDVAVKIFPFEESIELYSGVNGRMPWDFSGLHGDLNQRGGGGYYLCSDCNSHTGSWYVREYVAFVYAIHSILKELNPNPGNFLEFDIGEFYPLRVFKAVMTMFCDINNNCFGDEELREYLLDRNSTSFDTAKYSLFMYLVDGNIRRVNSLGAIIRSDVGHILVSEIACYPIGFALFIDRPDDFEAPGICINEFATIPYYERCKYSFVGVPYYSVNTQFPIDFRTKEEFMSYNSI